MNAPVSSPAGRDAADLAALIREQASSETAQLTADAHAHIERIRAASAVEIEAVHAAAVREGEERGRRRAAALLAVADSQARLTLLHARETHIQEALARTRNQLAELNGLPNARAVLAAFIREALRALDPGPVRVRVSESQAALLDDATRRQLAAGRWALHFEAAVVAGGGVIVETEDGRLRFDNSVDARIRRRTHELRQLAATLLWPAAEQERRT